MITLPDIPEVPTGNSTQVVAWLAITFLVVIIGGAIAILKLVLPPLKNLIERVGNIEDATNHRHPGAPTLVDHATATRSSVERVEHRIDALDNKTQQELSEIRQDISHLKAWANKWDDLPADISSDHGLVNKLSLLESNIEKIHNALVSHIQWETEKKYTELQETLTKVVAVASTPQDTTTNRTMIIDRLQDDK